MEPYRGEVVAVMPRRNMSLGQHIRRGLGKRCPVCAHKGIFDSWFKLKDRCPTCGYVFAREEGYWVSAIIVNMAVIEALFLILFIAIVLATAPEVEWAPLLVLGGVMNVVVPVLFYPYSKTVWMGVDLYFHPLETAERDQDRS